MTIGQPTGPRRPVRSSRFALALVLASVVAFFTATQGLVTALSEAQQARDGAAVQTRTAAESTALLLETQFDQQMQALAMLAALPDALDDLQAGRFDNLNARLERIGPSAPDISRFALIDRTGRIVANSSRDDKSSLGRSFADQPHVRVALQEGRASVGAPRPSTGGIPVVAVLPLGSPVFADDSQVVGVLQAALLLTRLNQDLAGVRVGEGGFVSVITTDGIITSHPDVARLLTPAAQWDQELVPLSDSLAPFIAWLSPSRSRWFVSEANMPSTGWTIRAQLPVDEAFSTFWQQLVWSGALSAVTGLLAFGVGMRLTRRFTSPLEQLTRAVETVGTGGQVEPRPASGILEIDRLDSAFDAMRERLTERTRRQEAAEAQLRRQATSLATLNELNQSMVSSLAIDDVLQAATASAKTLFSAVSAAFWRVDPEARTLHLIASSDPLSDERRTVQSVAFGQGVVAWVAEHGERQCIDDVFADGRAPDLDWWRRQELRSLFAIPIIDHGRVVGVLSLRGAEPFRLDDVDEHILRLFLPKVVIALRNAALYADEASARTAAELAETQFRALIEAAPDMVLVWDDRGWIQLVNRQAEVVVGYTIAELVGQHGKMLIREDQAPVIATLVSKANDQLGSTVSSAGTEFWFQHKDGRDIPIEMSLTTIRTPSGARRIATIRDITERRAMEQLKERFVSTVSHELRTPLTPIIGLAGLLAGSPLSDSQARMVDTIRRSGQNLLVIVNDLLDFSKIQANQLSLEAVPVDLRDLIEDVIDLLGAKAGDKDLNLACHVSPTVPGLVHGDPVRLRQILNNLVDNAIKFTASGEVIVRAHLDEETATSVLVRFEVSDTGIGVDPAVAESLFEPFTQASSSTTRQYGGTGLGLAICKRLAHLMDGQIGLDSAPGRGTTIWFTARLAKVTAERPAANRDLAPAAFQDLRLLIVDDSEANRLIFSEHVTSWGMSAYTAEDAEQALQLIRAAAEQGRPFNLALVDLNLPGQNGLDLTRVMQADALTSATRVLILSSSRRAELHQQAARVGASVYLQKPVRRAQLLEAILAVASASASTLEDMSVASDQPLRLDTAGQHPSRTDRSVQPILVVEDSPMNQLTVVGLLEQLGYRATAVENGRMALDALRDADYAAVLMDCQMPVMDGYEATVQIRGREDTSSRLPIIAMTASAMAADRARCLAIGMDDYITKPIEPTTLALALERWIVSPGEDAESTITSTAVIDPSPTSALDATRLNDLAEFYQATSPGLVGKIIELYCASAPSQVTLIRNALTQADPDALTQAAHKLKGESANLGVIEVVSIAHELEELGRSDTLDGVAAWLPQLDAAIADAMAALQQYRQATT